MRERRAEVQRSERRLIQREETLDKKADNMEARENNLNKKAEEIQRLQDEAEEMHARQATELERIGAMTQDEAKQIIIERVQKEAFHDAAAMVRDIENRAKEYLTKELKPPVEKKHFQQIVLVQLEVSKIGRASCRDRV